MLATRSLRKSFTSLFFISAIAALTLGIFSTQAHSRMQTGAFSEDAPESSAVDVEEFEDLATIEEVLHGPERSNEMSSLGNQAIEAMMKPENIQKILEAYAQLNNNFELTLKDKEILEGRQILTVAYKKKKGSSGGGGLISKLSSGVAVAITTVRPIECGSSFHLQQTGTLQTDAQPGYRIYSRFDLKKSSHALTWLSEGFTIDLCHKEGTQDSPFMATQIQFKTRMKPGQLFPGRGYDKIERVIQEQSRNWFDAVSMVFYSLQNNFYRELKTSHLEPAGLNP